MSRATQSISLTVAALIASLASQSARALLEVDELQNRIEAIKTSDDPQAVEKLIADVEEAGKTSTDEGYYGTVVELCGALNSSTKIDRKRAEMAWNLAANVLDSPAEKPLDAEVQLLLFLQSDPEYVKGELRGERWRNERLRRLRRWTATWGRLEMIKSNLPAVDGPPETSVSPPAGSLPFVTAGVAPEMIKDPVMRKQYEDAIAANFEKARIYRGKARIERLEARYLRPARSYFVEAYSQPPFDTDELGKTLAQAHFDDKFVAEVVSEVRNRVTARIARDEKLPNTRPTMQIAETLPVGDAVYYPDERLRKKVAFKLTAPKIEEILDELREQTGVTLTRADDIQNDYPARGGIIFSGTPAWKVMDKVAAYERVEGRWEKDGDGYRLVRNGNPVAPPEINEFAEVQPSPGWQRGVRLFGIALTTAIIGMLLYLLIRRKRLATS